MQDVKVSRGAWALVGILTGAVGLATSYLAASIMNLRESPVIAVAELFIRLVPGPIAKFAIEVFGTHDKAALLVGMLSILTVLFAVLGVVSARRWWLAILGFVALGVLAGISVLIRKQTTTHDLIPVVVGVITWAIALGMLSNALHSLQRDDVTDTETTATHRRTFLITAGVVAGLAAVSGLFGKVAGKDRSRVEAVRKLLRLGGVSAPVLPTGVTVDAEGVAPWMTPSDEFYLIDTAMIRPAIEPKEWSLRIHGMVEREITLSYDELVARQITEDWITLNCVSNEVGGELVGNAWWSGFRIADLLAEAGVDPEADAILQTSHDDWTCGTPIEAVTDDRNAMLAVAMNGDALPIDHGFPVRMIVPGLYGFVSATKWIIDIEVTKFSEFTAFWSDKGWSSMGPVKIASRIDLPRNGDNVSAGTVTFGGAAWKQHAGIESVEFAIDGGSWQPATLGRVPSVDTWVQWSATAEVDPGDHTVKVRAIGADGDTQTGAYADVRPDGATGWHTVDFSASA